MATKASKSEPQVYSYLRFSTPKQKWGDSEKRQRDIFKVVRRFAEKEKIQFNDTLCLADEGLSAYSGAHRKKGKLGLFLDMVKTGKIAKNSYLAVENIDRLSREPVIQAIDTIIMRIINFDISILTVSYNENIEPQLVEYNRTNINEKIGNLMDEIKTAHASSRRKSKMIRDARKSARDDARKGIRKLTGRCPAWLIPIRSTNEYGKSIVISFDVIEKAEQTINVIFEKKRNNVGAERIAKELNKSIAAWKRPKGWRKSYVQKILRNRAVIGEYQPFHTVNEKRVPIGEPIPNYYPLVVKPELFYAVQRRIKDNKGTGGRADKARNLFTNFVKCAYCGGSMAFKDGGNNSRHLVCENGVRSFKCSSEHRINYNECEILVLQNCQDLKTEQVLPNSDEQKKYCQLLQTRIQGYYGETGDIEERIENLDDQIERTKNRTSRDRYEARACKLQEHKLDIEGRKEEVERELSQVEKGLRSFTQWKKNLTTLLREIKKEDNVELRITLRSHLREFIDKVEVFSVGFKELYNSKQDKGLTGRIIHEDGKEFCIRATGLIDNTETAGCLLYEIAKEKNLKQARSKSFKELVTYFLKRRMSKEGRFLRIHYKSGCWIDLVTEGSLAFGYKLVKGRRNDKWEFVSPDLDKLWNEYKMEVDKRG